MFQEATECIATEPQGPQPNLDMPFLRPFMGVKYADMATPCSSSSSIIKFTVRAYPCSSAVITQLPIYLFCNTLLVNIDSMPLERPISRCQESQDPRFRGVSDILLAQFGQQAEPTQERLEIKEDQNNPIGSLAIGITASSVTLGEVMQNQIDEPLETTSGMCRASFGIDWKERYNKDKPHRHQSKRQEILKGGWVVMNRMKWLLDKVST